MDAYESLVSDPWYAVVCEAHHALLGLLLGLALLAGYFLISLTMAYFSRGGRRTSPFYWSAALSLALLSFSMGLIGHYAGDFGYLGGWWRW